MEREPCASLVEGRCIVNTAEELQQAVNSKQPHVEIQSHLDLRQLDVTTLGFREFTLGVDESVLPALLVASNTTVRVRYHSSH